MRHALNSIKPFSTFTRLKYLPLPDRMHLFLASAFLFSICLQPRNYQVSKELVHELKFGDIAVMQI